MFFRLRYTLIIVVVCGFIISAPAIAQQASDPAPIAEEEIELSELPEAVSDATPTEATPDKPLRHPSANDPAPADPSLLPVFKAFGELPGLKALMDDFMVLLLADTRISSFFADADQTRIKAQLVEQFCVILGGPCTYSGRDMKSTHAGLSIDRANFNALVEDLQMAMNKRGIPFRAQNKLLAKLAPMHREIEGR